MASIHARQRDPLLDQNTTAMLERRGRELIGIGLLALALLFSLILGSYSPQDPGWMVATEEPAQNMLGRFGAAISSTLFIIGGKGAWMIPVLLAVWGLRFVTHRGADRAVGRVVFAVIAVAMASVWAATLVPGADWPHSFGLGGLFGDTILGTLLGVAPVNAGLGLTLFSIVFGLLVLALGLWVSGFTVAELGIFGRFVSQGAVMAYDFAMTLAGRGTSRAADAWAEHRATKAEAAANREVAQAQYQTERLSAADAVTISRDWQPEQMAAPRHNIPAQPRPAATIHRAPQAQTAPAEALRPSGATAGEWGRPDALRSQLRADPRYPEPMAEAPHYAPPREKLGLLARMPQLMRRSPEPEAEPELFEPMLPEVEMDLPVDDDRIKARISDAIRAKMRHPGPTLNPGGNAARREPPVLANRNLTQRLRGPQPLLADTRRPPQPTTAQQSAAQQFAAQQFTAQQLAAQQTAAQDNNQIASQMSTGLQTAAASVAFAANPASTIPPAPPLPASYSRQHWEEEDPGYSDWDRSDWQDADRDWGDLDHNLFVEEQEARFTPAPRTPETAYAGDAVPAEFLPSYSLPVEPPLTRQTAAQSAPRIEPALAKPAQPIAPLAAQALAVAEPVTNAFSADFNDQTDLEAEWEHRDWQPGDDLDADYDMPPVASQHAPMTDTRKAVVHHAASRQTPLSTRTSHEVPSRMRFEELTSQPYELPPLDLLSSPSTIERHALSDDALEENARMLESVLDDYGVKGEIVSVRPGPVVTMYELEPAPGLKASRVIGLADDIARSMSALSARVSTVPGRSVIGIELPNAVREKVVLREILAARDFGDSNMRLPLALGKDIGGDAIVANLAKMPHLLIAGTTGSGKSVAINTMILSLLYKLTPEECRLIMIDPKMLELSVYDGIPHLLSPVVTDPKKAVVALKWVVSEMEERYRKMSKMGVRNIEGYNGRVREALAKGEMFKRTIQTGFDEDTGEPVFETDEFAPVALPYIVVIVDEMADLMMVAGKEIEACIQRLAQMARASGIHLIMATQRPSVDVITGTIKANFPTRISFQVTSKIDSRTILGEQGAEQLLGMGDMLYMGNGAKITRIHGPFVSDEEVEEIVNHLKSFGPPVYMSGVVEGPDEDVAGEIDQVLGLNTGGNTEGEDALYDQAVAIVARDRKCSTSYIQRKLGIGYNKAARLVEQMEEQGIVTPANHVGKREILIPEH